MGKFEDENTSGASPNAIGIRGCHLLLEGFVGAL
jgi:hypothetical protein